jgi:hypothetical protein
MWRESLLLKVCKNVHNFQSSYCCNNVYPKTSIWYTCLEFMKRTT